MFFASLVNKGLLLTPKMDCPVTLHQFCHQYTSELVPFIPCQEEVSKHSTQHLNIINPTALRMAKTQLSFANGLNLTNQSNKQMNTTFVQYFWNIFSTMYAMNKLSHGMRKNSLYHLHSVKTKINLHTCNLI